MVLFHVQICAYIDRCKQKATTCIQDPGFLIKKIKIYNVKGSYSKL